MPQASEYPLDKCDCPLKSTRAGKTAGSPTTPPRSDVQELPTGHPAGAPPAWPAHSHISSNGSNTHSTTSGSLRQNPDSQMKAKCDSPPPLLPPQPPVPCAKGHGAEGLAHSGHSRLEPAWSPSTRVPLLQALATAFARKCPEATPAGGKSHPGNSGAFLFHNFSSPKPAG
jgi:hypothetical protein